MMDFKSTGHGQQSKESRRNVLYFSRRYYYFFAVDIHFLKKQKTKTFDPHVLESLLWRHLNLHTSETIHRPHTIYLVTQRRVNADCELLFPPSSYQRQHTRKSQLIFNQHTRALVFVRHICRPAFYKRYLLLCPKWGYFVFLKIPRLKGFLYCFLFV